MSEEALEEARGELVISTDRGRLDLDTTLTLVRATHWGNDVRREVLARAIEGSICFGVYCGRQQIGFARAVTDRATYAYLTDVVIAEGWRGQGIGEWLTRFILDHPDLQGLRRVALLTRDARRLYERFGFGTDTGELVYMERQPREE